MQPLDLFYARPSLSAPVLLVALAEAAAGVAGQAAGGLTRPNDQGEEGGTGQAAGDEGGALHMGMAQRFPAHVVWGGTAQSNCVKL